MLEMVVVVVVVGLRTTEQRREKMSRGGIMMFRMARQWSGWGRLEVVQGEGGGGGSVQTLIRRQELRTRAVDRAVRI